MALLGPDQAIPTRFHLSDNFRFYGMRSGPFPSSTPYILAATDCSRCGRLRRRPLHSMRTLTLSPSGRLH